VPRAKLAAGSHAASSMHASSHTLLRRAIAGAMLLGACSVHADTAMDQGTHVAGITLQRSSCFGNCPAYSVTMTPRGEVSFEGHAHVQTRSAHGHATPAQIAQIRAALERADLRAMRESYVAQDDGCDTVMSDQSGVKITVVDATSSKTVEFYNGCTGAVADAVRPRIERLASTIDQQLDTARWIGKQAAPGEIETTGR
jgi:hypothetical protein